MLDLIDDGALAELSEKAPRIRFRKVPLVGRFQVGILEAGKGCAAERRLAGLARPGHGHKGVLPEEGRQPVCDLALDHDRQDSSVLRNLQVVLSICAAQLLRNYLKTTCTGENCPSTGSGRTCFPFRSSIQNSSTRILR